LKTLHADCVIVGGGFGGVAAALSATDAGCRVIMTECYNWIGGQVTSQGLCALDELSAGGALEGLVIDNRYNGGGASDVLLNTLGYFTTGPVGTFIENRQQIQLRAGRQQETRFQNLPLVVLIGPGTASFGEVFAGALKDLGRAYLIGEQTEGNVEVLSIFDLSDGSRAWIATSTFRPLNHPNQNWEETGIIPDRTVRSAWDEFTLETDPAILSALQYFDGTLSNANP